MKTQEQAKREGYDVDPMGMGRPMASRGAIPNLEMVPLFTDLEDELLRTLGLVRGLLVGQQPSEDMRRQVVASIDLMLRAAGR